MSDRIDKILEVCDVGLQHVSEHEPEIVPIGDVAMAAEQVARVFREAATALGVAMEVMADQFEAVAAWLVENPDVVQLTVERMRRPGRTVGDVFRESR